MLIDKFKPPKGNLDFFKVIKPNPERWRDGVRRENGVLLILPLVFLAAELLLRHHGLPYWLWFNLDPSYLYLIGGLNILQHAPPAQFQHPGVPLQLLVAAVAWFTPAVDRLKDAETILSRVNYIVLLVVTLALWFMGQRIWRRTNLLLPALFAQLAPFITMLTLKRGIEVEPETLLLGSMALLMAMMVEDNARPRMASLFGVALTVAFGTACKVTFAPLGLAPLIVMRDSRRRIAYVVLTAILFALWMIPEIPNWAPMTAWFMAVFLHSGTYGQGPETVVAWAHYPHQFAKLFFARPLFLGPFVLGIVALSFGRRGTPTARALLALLVTQFVEITLVAKHASGHYILPALVLAGPVLGMTWLLMFESGRVPLRLAGRIGALILAALIVAQATAFARQDAELRRRVADARSIDLAADLPQCAHVYYFMASAPSAAWFYNASYASQNNVAFRYGAQLKAMMPPNDYFSEPWQEPIANWDGPVTAAALEARYPCVALRSVKQDAIEELAKQFGPMFNHAARCRIGEEFILIAGAKCPAAGSP